MEKGGVVPQLPNDIHWNSQLDCIKTYISNDSLYVDIRGEHMESIDPSIGRLIENMSIQREAIDLQAQRKIVGDALDKVNNLVYLVNAGCIIFDDNKFIKTTNFWHHNIINFICIIIN